MNHFWLDGKYKMNKRAFSNEVKRFSQVGVNEERKRDCKKTTRHMREYIYSRNAQNIHMNREKDRGGTRWFEIDGGSEKNVPK